MGPLNRMGARALAAVLSAAGVLAPTPSAGKTLEGGVRYFEDDFDPVREEAVSDVGEKGERTEQAANQNQLMKALVQGLQAGAKGLDAAGKSRLEEVDATKEEAAEASGVVAEGGERRLAERLKALNRNARTGRDRDIPLDPDEGKVRAGGAIGNLRRNLADGLAQGAAGTGGPEAGLKDAVRSRPLGATPKLLRGGVETKARAAGAALGPVDARAPAHGRLQGTPPAKAAAADPYEAHVRDAAKLAGVRPEFIKFLRGRETGGSKNPNTAVSSKGAKGAMQLMGEICSAKSLGGKMDPCDPSQAFTRAGKLLRYYRTHPKFKRWHTDDPAVLAALYNMGENRFRRAGLHRRDLGWKDAKGLKGRLSKETWRYLYQDAKSRKGLYGSRRELRGMTRAERERWLRSEGAAKAPAPAPRPAAAPARTLTGRVAAAGTGPVEGLSSALNHAAQGVLDPKNWMQGAQAATGPEPLFGEALRAQLPAVDVDTARDVAARFPELEGSSPRELDLPHARALIEKAILQKYSGLELFSHPELGRKPLYLLSGKTAAALTREYDLHLLSVPKGVAKDGRPFAQKYILLGDGAVRVVYDRGPFDFYNDERKKTFTFQEVVRYEILGPGRMAIQGAEAHKNVFGVPVKVGLKQFKIVDGGNVEVKAGPVTLTEKLQPIERAAPGRRAPEPVDGGKPSGKKALPPAAALLLLPVAAAAGVGATRLLAAVRSLAP